MKVLNAEETIRFFRSYGVKDEESVKAWVEENNKNADPNSKNQPVDEWDLYDYNTQCYVKGTAYEPGIDDKTKIERLIEENALLKKEIEELRAEKYRLEKLLGINDWF